MAYNPFDDVIDQDASTMALLEIFLWDKLQQRQGFNQSVK
jgi:hypothetical protein